MIPVTIHKISLSEASILHEFSSRTFYEAFAHLNSEANMNDYITKAFGTEQLASEIRNPETEFYFAKLNEVVVGYIKLNTGNTQTDLKEKNGLEIERIYVDKKFQGSQIGKLLLEKAIEAAQRKHSTYIWLGVWEENRNAIRFYEKNGFVKTGSHPFMLGDDLQTDIIMRLDVTLDI